MIETKFKDTELGLIPQDWEIKMFGDVLQTFSSGATPYRGNPSNFRGNIRWISSGELNYCKIYDTIEHISKEAQISANLKMHKPGTFLMAITGLEAEGTRGRCAIVGAESTTNQSCLAINSTDKMTVDYLYWFYLKFSDYYAFKYCQGSKQQSYTSKIVKKLPIYFPTNIKEQERIASALTSIDNLLSSLTSLIEKKKLIKQGAMQELLTGKKRLKGFDGEWKEIKLGNIVDVKNGYPFDSKTYEKTGKYLIVTISNVQQGKFDNTIGNRLSILPINIQKHQLLQIGDMIISMTGNIGRICIVNTKNCLLNQRVGKFMLNSKIITQFFYQRLLYNDFIRYLELTSKGAAQQNISSNDIKSFIFKIPPTLEEQQAIADVLTSMDKDIEALEAKRAKYENIKQGMMQQLLTGKIRLI